MKYVIRTEAPNRKQGEDKWSAELSVPDGRKIIGYGVDEMRAMLDVVKLAWDKL